MKRIILAFLLVAPATLGWATDYYLVGDATTIGWTTGEANRSPTKMTESSTSGVYVWTGPLKHAAEGFFICNAPSGWSGYGSSVEKSGGSYYSISEVGGTDSCTEKDNKWNPTNTEYEYYTITLNTTTSPAEMSWTSIGATDGNGYYSIDSASDLYIFAEIVNKYDQSAKAKLTDNIDYSAYPQGFIGTSSSKFAGTFDGQEHTVTIALVGDAKIRGLFAYINGATIRNLVVDGSITSGYNNIGGLGGQVDGSCTVENVVVNTSISYTPGSDDASIGGFFPYVYNDQTLTIRNCAFYGSVNAGTATGNAGLVAWNSGTINATNCLVAPKALETGSNGFDDYARYHAPSTSNCYRGETDDARFASGELCYLLNNGGTNWYQTLGTDDIYPYPFGTLTVGRGQWLSDDYLYYNIDGSGNITIPRLDLSENDTKYEVPANVTAKNVSIARNIPAGQWIGLCLPFDLDAIPSGWDVRELAYVNGTGDDASMIFRSATSIEAGKPYLVKPASRVETITVTDTDTPIISKADATAVNTVSDGGVNMIGNLCQTSILMGSYYINTSSLLKKLTAASANLKGFRAYFTVDAVGGGSPVKALSYGFEEDDATGIEEALSNSPLKGEDIYNLAGQRIQKVQKGINIVNGKKVLF